MLTCSRRPANLKKNSNLVSWSCDLSSKSRQKKRPKPRRTKNTSTLEQHKVIGKTLVSPLMQMQPGFQFRSWMDSRLPEVLWLLIIGAELPRQQSLQLFLALAEVGLVLRESPDSKSQHWSLNHSAIQHLPSGVFSRLCALVKQHPPCWQALRSLLILEDLPAKEIWAAELGDHPGEETSWKYLQTTVARSLFHQSDLATDVRWVSCMFSVATHQLVMPQHMVAEFLRYPEVFEAEDGQRIQASVRAMELGGQGLRDSSDQGELKWSNLFWDQCLRRTECFTHPPVEPSTALPLNAEVIDCVEEIRSSLQRHWMATVKTSEIDARHDAAFGLLLWGLDLIDELTNDFIRFGITGRLLVRTLTECRINLAYLVQQDQPELWSKFRQYGTGQAKLALLKMENDGGLNPCLVDEATLNLVANEDRFQEFVNVELGHWCKLDLRRMAQESGTKDDYDRYYGWASTFVHSQWAAVRICSFTTCLNPLHRLHRIPLPDHPMLEDALPSALVLLGRMCECFMETYPGLELPATWEKMTTGVGREGQDTEEANDEAKE